METPPERPASLACVQCRRKHVKCDAGAPQCRRCRSCGLQCHYQPSRRGLKRRLYHSDTGTSPVSLSNAIRRPGILGATKRPGPREPEQIAWSSADPRQELSHFPIDNDQSNWTQQELTEIPSQLVQAEVDDTGGAPEDESLEDDELLINLFYAHFHNAHPFLVPRGLYFSQCYPSYLRLVVHLIGCHFSGTACSDTLSGIATEALDNAHHVGPRGFVMVQALLLFSIVQHARNDVTKSVSFLAQAVTLALDIGMSRKEFALVHGKGTPVLEESLRRTWWELYVTEGFMAALQQKTSFRCHLIAANVPLPCDEALYVEGAFMMEPPSLEMFESRIYMEEEVQFSSFCYRIEATRLLARALAIARTQEIHQEQFQAIDNALAAWPHHLGPGNAEPINISGGIDEMLFQAHMLIQYTTMYLHFPRSDLLGVIPIASGVTPQWSLLPVYSRSLHGIEAIEASKHLGNMASLRASVKKHTPFFFDGLLLSAIVQLAACSLRPSGFQEHCRDRLYLITGVFKSLSSIWALARETLRKIKAMAMEALSNNSKTFGQAESLEDSAIEVRTSTGELNMTDLGWMEMPNWGLNT